MNCIECESTVVTRRATSEKPYAYKLSELPGVFLVGISVNVCPSCGLESPVIPRLTELHRVIAHTLHKKPTPLNGAEIKFLRKVIGVSAQKFAKGLRIDPTYLSKVENGHATVGESLDQLIRLYTLTRMAQEDQKAQALLWQIVDEVEKPVKEVQEAPFYELKNNQWKPKKAA